MPSAKIPSPLRTFTKAHRSEITNKLQLRELVEQNFGQEKKILKWVAVDAHLNMIWKRLQGRDQPTHPKNGLLAGMSVPMASTSDELAPRIFPTGGGVGPGAAARPTMELVLDEKSHLTAQAAHDAMTADHLSFKIGATRRIDPVQTTFSRPVFEHGISWAEFQKDPNRYASQFFIGNGNFTEVGISFGATPVKRKSLPGYGNVYQEAEYPAVFKAGVSVFRTTDVEGGRTVANSCGPHLPYLSYHCIKEPGQPYYSNSRAASDRFEITNSGDLNAIRNNVRDGSISYQLALHDKSTKHTVTQTAEKFASFVDPAISCSRQEITADFAGDLIIRSGFDGTLINNSTESYNQFEQRHIEQGPNGVRVLECGQTMALSLQTIKESSQNIDKLKRSEYDDNPISVTPEVVSTQAQYQFGLAKRVRYFIVNEKGIETEIRPRKLTAEEAGDQLSDARREVYVYAKIHLKPGQRLIVEDRSALVSSIDSLSSDNLLATAEQLVSGDAPRYAEAKEAHTAEWRRQFSQNRIGFFGGHKAMEFQAALDLCRGDLLKTISEHNRDIAADMGAKGLHDGRYRTHNFWEMAIFFWKVKAMQDPDAAKGMARLYIKNLEIAKQYAKSMGHSQGAQFGWQTTADGKPDTQVVKWNSAASKWDSDFSKYQPHNNWALFYGIDQIYRVSGDDQFLVEAMPLLIELVRLGRDFCQIGGDGKYHTVGMMGPNEFNEKQPGSKNPDLPDSFYNNFMIAKMADRIFELLEHIPIEARGRILSASGMTEKEMGDVKSLSRNMYFPITTVDKNVPQVDLSGNILGEQLVPAGTIENYAGFTDMPLVHWPSMRGWLDKENMSRDKPINASFNDRGIVPRADQVLKGVYLTPGLARVLVDIMEKKGVLHYEAMDRNRILNQAGELVWLICDDQVLDGEGKRVWCSPDNFQIGKQQDALQTVVNFSAEEVVELLEENGYHMNNDTISRNIAYYADVVNTNGSSLANVGNAAGKIRLKELDDSVRDYQDVLFLDVRDLEQGTARQGFRAGNMAATELLALHYLGLDMDFARNHLSINPQIPKAIGGIEAINVAYGKYRLFIQADGAKGVVRMRAEGLTEGETLKVWVAGKPCDLQPHSTSTLYLRPRRNSPTSPQIEAVSAFL